MWGITRRVALKAGYAGDMHFLPRDTAKAIYLKQYWAPMHCDEVPDAARYAVFDGAVNCGTDHATEWVQEAVGVEVDGDLGPQTLAAIVAADGVKLAAVFLGLQLAAKTTYPTWSAFGKGWSSRIANILKGLL